MKKFFSFVLALVLCTGTVFAQGTSTEIKADNAEQSATPRMLVWDVQSYNQDSYTYDWTYQDIGVNRVDNTDNLYTEAELYVELSETCEVGTTLMTGTLIGGEVEMVVAKVKAEVTATASSTVSRAKGTIFGSNTKVPPGKIGIMYVYVPAVYSQGTMTYTILDTSNDSIWTESRGIGMKIPFDNGLNTDIDIIDP